jgi:hypothetical protein
MPVGVCPSVERKLLFIKALHFVTCLTGAAWGRYASIYLNTQRNLTPVQNGLVRGVGLGGKLLLTPLWGAWSDRGQPRALLTTSTWMCAALFIFYRLDATYEWIGLLVLLKVVLGLSHIFALLL